MSIKLMSAIFETEFRDLSYTKDGDERKAKASTAKLLLLAIADHANDYGESAYPGYDKLEIKTALSRQGIADTLDALKQNGLILVSDEPSRLGTNDYTINIHAFPKMDESSHLTNPSQATLLAGVKPLDLNHQLTINKPPVVAVDTSTLYTAYSNEIGVITPMIADSIDDWSKTVQAEWITKAIHEAATQNKRNWKYCEAILKRWQAQGFMDEGKPKAEPKPEPKPVRVRADDLDYSKAVPNPFPRPNFGGAK